MKLIHRRWFSGRLMQSVTHYSANDRTADQLAATVRKELSTQARVVQDDTGWRHVFVPITHYSEALAIADRREYR